MKHIILIGYMGSGKSTVGPLLAAKVNMEFVDIDEFIEKSEGMSISDMFSVFGEEYFRRKEQDALRKILEHNPCVIATGGGIVLNPSNVCLMQENGYVIYLKADTDVLYNRVKDSTNRPLLHGDDVYGKFTAIFYKRQSLYENVAHYIVDTSFLLAEQVVDEILDVLDKGEGSF